MMHYCENRGSLVCGSKMAFVMSSMDVCTTTSRLLKYSRAKSRVLIGEPSRQKPVVSSAGNGGPMLLRLLGLVE